MVWYDPRSGQAEVVENAEGQGRAEFGTAEAITGA